VVNKEGLDLGQKTRVGAEVVGGIMITISDPNFQLPTHELARLVLKLSVAAFEAEEKWGYGKGEHVARNIPTVVWEDSLQGNRTDYKDCGLIAEAIEHFNLSHFFNSNN